MSPACPNFYISVRDICCELCFVWTRPPRFDGNTPRLNDETTRIGGCSPRISKWLWCKFADLAIFFHTSAVGLLLFYWRLVEEKQCCFILLFMSADIMAPLCSVRLHVNISICLNNFSKSTRERDMVFVLKNTLSIEDEILFKASRSVCLFPRAVRSEVPLPRV